MYILNVPARPGGAAAATKAETSPSTVASSQPGAPAAQGRVWPAQRLAAVWAARNEALLEGAVSAGGARAGTSGMAKAYVSPLLVSGCTVCVCGSVHQVELFEVVVVRRATRNAARTAFGNLRRQERHMTRRYWRLS